MTIGADHERSAAAHDPITMPPDEFQRFIASEVRKWTEVVKAANIKGDL